MSETETRTLRFLSVIEIRKQTTKQLGFFFKVENVAIALPANLYFQLFILSSDTTHRANRCA